MKSDGQDTAFPFDDIGPHYGLSKREYFAARAMQGILSTHVVITPDDKDKLAVACCQYADALLAELNK